MSNHPIQEYSMFFIHSYLLYWHFCFLHGPLVHDEAALDEHVKFILRSSKVLSFVYMKDTACMWAFKNSLFCPG